MANRTAEVKRKTGETDIALKLNLDGTGKYKINTGSGFLNHMLELFTYHGKFDLTVECTGDIHVDAHHTVEDVAICLGQAFSKALADRKGIQRYGSFTLPMDEALILAAVDISGRDVLCCDLCLTTSKVGTFDTELVKEFWLGFVRNCKMSLHINKLAGDNNHHIIEGAFKAVARALSIATAIDEKYAGEMPSTKGMLV